MSNESPARTRYLKIIDAEFIRGVLLAPILLGIAWCYPVEFGDFFDSKYLFLLLLNILTAYPDFAFHFSVTHFIVTRTKMSGLHSYLLVICALSIFIFLGLKAYYLRGINGLGYNGVVVLQNGVITVSGYNYLLKECVINVFGHVGAMCLFWCIAFRPDNSNHPN